MEVGVEPQSGSILRDRIRQTAGHRRQGQSQVVVKVGAIAFEAHRRLELGHRFRFPSGNAHERHPQIVVEVGAAGIACQVSRKSVSSSRYMPLCCQVAAPRVVSKRAARAMAATLPGEIRLARTVSPEAAGTMIPRAARYWK